MVCQICPTESNAIQFEIQYKPYSISWNGLDYAVVKKINETIYFHSNSKIIHDKQSFQTMKDIYTDELNLLRFFDLFFTHDKAIGRHALYIVP